ncbi:MAG: ATP-binding protein [Longimicrobiales bacterium]
MGQTRVDLLHLLEDLRDAYPGSLEETILTEIVANALDSGATDIALDTDAGAATLTVRDDGKGMTRRELSRFHDLAATNKRRGRGIGFAGVGIKLALLACDEAITESRRGNAHVATSWRLASRQRAPWNWVPPPGLVTEQGTAVRLRLSNPLSELLDPGYVEATLLRHFVALFDPFFEPVLASFYPRPVRFTVNHRLIDVAAHATYEPDRAPIAVKIGRKRKPSAIGWLARSLDPLPEEHQGVAISTLGKVIKRGWDWLGVTPAAPEHVHGLIEAPPLAESLTLNKADFIRTGPRGATYLAYRKVIQEAVTAQLAHWGDIRDTAAARRTRTRPIERDMEAVLVDLADEFPLLATLVERRRGGQRRLPLGQPSPHPADDWSPAQALTAEQGTAGSPDPASDRDHTGALSGPGETSPSGTEKPAGEDPDVSAAPPGLPGAPGPRKPGRYGLQIRFAERPDDPELGRLIESIVWVNEAHPAWRRAVRARAEGYHIALTVAMSLAPLAVEPPCMHGFVTTFLDRWGREEENGARRTRKRAKR